MQLAFHMRDNPLFSVIDSLQCATNLAYLTTNNNKLKNLHDFLWIDSKIIELLSPLLKILDLGHDSLSLLNLPLFSELLGCLQFFLNILIILIDLLLNLLGLLDRRRPINFILLPFDLLVDIGNQRIYQTQSIIDIPQLVLKTARVFLELALEVTVVAFRAFA